MTIAQIRTCLTMFRTAVPTITPASYHLRLFSVGTQSGSERHTTHVAPRPATVQRITTNYATWPQASLM